MILVRSSLSLLQPRSDEISKERQEGINKHSLSYEVTGSSIPQISIVHILSFENA